MRITKTNPLIFIRPTIIRDEVALEGATAEKYRYIRDQQAIRRERSAVFSRLHEANALTLIPEQVLLPAPLLTFVHADGSLEQDRQVLIQRRAGHGVDPRAGGDRDNGHGKNE